MTAFEISTTCPWCDATSLLVMANVGTAGVHSCTTCGGDGHVDCNGFDGFDACTSAGCTGTSHRCPNCGGSGAAEDQRYW